MSIRVSTTTPSRAYEIIDTVFAIDSSTDKMFKSINPGEAFQGVKQQLADICRKIGGDAVVCCQFEYRNATADGLMGKKQVLEIFAYGTVIKLSLIHISEPTRPY